MTLRPLSAAFVAVALLGLLGSCGEPPVDLAGEAERATLKSEVEKLRKDADRSGDEIRRLRSDLSSQARDVAALSERLAKVEDRPVVGGAAPAVAPANGPTAPTAAEKKAQLDEMELLRKKVFDGSATDEEERRFWELARTTGRVDEMIKSLEAKVKAAPNDIPGRMDLAQAYIAKLLTLTPGPEQGTLSRQAMEQWQAVLKLEPENWDARYSVAFNWSMWPDFLNKTPDAISEFEKLRDLQERRTPEAKQAQTYLQLSRLYMKQGKADKAREMLQAGLQRHPGDGELTKSLDSLRE